MAERSVVLPLIGHTVAVPLDEPGIVRALVAGGVEASWIVVPSNPYVGVSDEEGKVLLEQVPPGTYQVTAWHPPVETTGRGAAQALAARAEVTVTTGKTSAVVLSLAAAPVP